MLLSSIGAMGETVVLGWLTLELSNSPLVVGVAMAMRMLPMFFVGVPAGALADRWPRHRVLMLAAAGQALTAGTLGVLGALGQITLTHVLMLTLAAGTLRALEHAARQSYVHDVVGAPALLPGLAVLGVAMRAGWLVGSLGAGAVIARFGSGAAYLAVAGGFGAGAAALLTASSPARVKHAEPETLWRSVIGFASSMRTDRTLIVLMTLTAGAEMLGFSHQALLPSLARDVLRAGPEGLGALNAARSVGGILGLTLASMRGPVAGGGALFVTVLLLFGGSLVALGLAPYVVHFAGVVVVLVLVNALGALADLLAQSLLQLSAPEHRRGRAGGAWVVAIGLAPLGQLQIGALATVFGVSVAFGASGLALVVLAGATALLFPRLRRL
jgi:MFS family permease